MFISSKTIYQKLLGVGIYSRSFTVTENTVVPAMYSPKHEQTLRMCGHVSIYGYFPTEIPCKKQPPENSI